MAKRLERVRTLKGIASLKDFWKALGGKEGAGCGYEAVRFYHFDREAPVSYLSRVAQVFPEFSREWLLTGEGDELRAAAAPELLSDDADPVGATLQQTFPLHAIVSVGAREAIRSTANRMAFRALKDYPLPARGRAGVAAYTKAHDDAVATATRVIAQALMGGLQPFVGDLPQVGTAQFTAYVKAACLAFEQLIPETGAGPTLSEWWGRFNIPGKEYLR